MNEPFGLTLRAVEFFSLFLLLLLAGLFLYLSLRKNTINRNQRRFAESLRALQEGDSALQQYLESGKEGRLLHQGRLGESPPVRAALQHRLTVSGSQQERERIYTFARRHFRENYARMLKSRRWSRRVNALLEIELFRIDSLKTELTDMLNRRQRISEEERFLILRIFAVFHDPELLTLLRQEAITNRLSESQLLQLLLPLGPQIREELIADFSGYPLRVQMAAVDALRIGNDRTSAVLGLLEILLDSTEIELRIRSLNALANFGYMSPKGEEAFQSLLRGGPGGSAEERQARARLMGSIRDEAYKPHLNALLGDSSYAVRQTAADSLSRYRSGEELLLRVISSHPDRYAREMAEETLERKRYEGIFH